MLAPSSHATAPLGLSRRSLIVVAAIGFATLMAPAAARAEVDPAFAAHTKGSTATVDHAAFDTLLKTYVATDAQGLNRVGYKAFKASGHAALKAYLAGLEKVDVAKLDRPEQFAFWANLYNAKTIDIVLDKYPVASIKDISLGGGLLASVTGGPWKAKVLKVAGTPLSLDDIEHQIIRPGFKDPRAHYSVNCASFGCPNLQNEAFTGAKLQAMLDAGAKAYVNHPRGIAVEGGTVKASSIYDWFVADFGGNAKGVLEHVRKFASPELASKLKGIETIGDYGYDWSLNDAK